VYQPDIAFAVMPSVTSEHTLRQSFSLVALLARQKRADRLAGLTSLFLPVVLDNG